MDFLKLLRSFEDLLFEVLSWLIFYPRTLALVVRNPLGMIRYSDREQSDEGAARFPDSLSPALVLLLTVALSHGLELAAGPRAIAPEGEAMRVMVGSDENLIVVRALLFGPLPLMAAVRFVRARGLPLDRMNLRDPFFGQCYLVAPYALAISLANLLARIGPSGAGWAGALVAVAATAWYLCFQTLHFRSAVPAGPLRALGMALWSFLAAFAYVTAFAVVLVREA